MAEIESPITAVPKMAPGEHVRYVPNHRSFGAFIKSEQMRSVTADVAHDIAVMAKELTPSSDPDAQEHTGLHEGVREGFDVRREAGMMKVGGNLRVMVEVINTDERSSLVEFGTRGVDRERPLGRAGALFGDFKPQDEGPRIERDTQASGPLL